MKESQADFAGIVMRVDAIRNIAAPAWRRLVTVDAHFQCDNCSFGRIGNPWTISAIDHTVRRQVDKISNARLGARGLCTKQRGKQTRYFRTNAGKRANGREEGIKQ